MTVFTPVLRHSLRTCKSPLRHQRRWARVHDVRFVATHRDQDQVLDKYRDKLAEKAKEEGLESITELKDAYKDKISAVRRKASTPSLDTSQSKNSPLQQRPPPPPQPIRTRDHPGGRQSSSAAPGIKPLSSYLDLDKVSSLPQKELEMIWRLRFANDSMSLCAIIPLNTYKRIYQTARQHPQFILPLPRPAAENGSGEAQQNDQGFEGGNRTAADIHFLQWGFHPAAMTPAEGATSSNTHISTVLFTHLAAFKLHGTYAQPHTTVTHHLDLADSHGLVLLNGSVVKDKGVSAEEGRWLLMCLQKFYDFEGHGGGIGKEKRQGLLEKFSKGDQAFNIEELVDEAERVS